MWVLLQSHYIRSHLGSPIYNVTAQYSVMLATVLFIRGDWNAKVGSQEIPGVPGKFGLGGQNETRQRPTEFCQEHALVIANTLFQQHKRRLYTWTSPDGLIIFFAAKDGEILYNQQKQDQELTVA